MPVHNENSAADVSVSIPVLEERVRLDKKTVESGRVQVRIVNTSEERQLQAALQSEAVQVERRAVGRELAAGEALPVPHEEDGGAVFVIPVLEEVLVVEKRWVVREELRLHRTTSTEQIEETVTVLRQQAAIERLPADSRAEPGMSRP